MKAYADAAHRQVPFRARFDWARFDWARRDWARFDRASVDE